MKETLLKVLLKFLPKRRIPGELNKDLKGIKKDKPDDRDYKVYQVLTGIVDKPQFYQLVIDPYKYVKDQGKWNSCASHAIATAMEIYHDLHETKLKGIEFSERFHYYLARMEAGTLPNNVGQYMRDTMKIAKKYGVCPEKLCPYIDSKMNEAPGIFTGSFAQMNKLKGYYRATTLDEVKTSLINNLPVLVGIQTTSSFKRMIGSIEVVDKEATYGGHAIVIYGYDNMSEELLCINSWGKKYKDKGIMRLPFDYFSKYVYDIWTFAI